MEDTLHKVSIIIPYVKDRGYLDEAIQSVKDQTYKGEIELILSQSDGRVGFNINRGIEASTGDYVKYLCDDDLLTPNCIADSVIGMDWFDFIHGNAIDFYEDGRVQDHRAKIKHPTLRDMLLFNQIHGGTLMYRRDVFERFGMWDEELWTGEEYDYNMMLLSNGAKIGYVGSNLYKYRRHSEQKSIGILEGEYQFKRTHAKELIKKRYV